MANGIDKWTAGYRTSKQMEELDTFNRPRFQTTQYYLADVWTKQFTTDKTQAYFFPDYRTAQRWIKQTRMRCEPVKVWQWYARSTPAAAAF
jgi:predicted secreted hydrolase